MAGYRAAKGNIIIQMDDDGQCNPEGILPLIDKIKEGYDVAYAKYPEEKKTKFRSIGSEFNRRMCISLINMPGDIHPTSFAAYKRFIVEEMVRYDKPYPYIGGLVFRSTTNICNVEVEHRKRMSGKSNYKLKTLFKLWLNGFTAFSVKPLEIASLSGFAIAIIGVIYADHLRSRNGERLELIKIGQEPVALAQMKKLKIRAEGFGYGVQLLIGRHDADNAVAGVDERVENVVVCARRAVGRDDLVRLQSLIQLADAAFELRKTFNMSVGQALCGKAVKKCGLIHTRYIKKLVRRSSILQLQKA